MAPSPPHDGPKTAPGCPRQPQDGPQMAPRPPKMAENGSTMAPGRPNVAQDGPAMAPRPPGMTRDGANMARAGFKMASSIFELASSILNCPVQLLNWPVFTVELTSSIFELANLEAISGHFCPISGHPGRSYLRARPRRGGHGGHLPLHETDVRLLARDGRRGCELQPGQRRRRQLQRHKRRTQRQWLLRWRRLFRRRCHSCLGAISGQSWGHLGCRLDPRPPQDGPTIEGAQRTA